jgi:hypothetical protein
MVDWSRTARLFKAGLASRGVMPDRRAGPLQRDRAGPLDRDGFGEVGINELYELYRKNNAIRKSVQALRDTILMNGYEWQPTYGAKCKVCREEYGVDEEPDWCRECGAHTALDANEYETGRDDDLAGVSGESAPAGPEEGEAEDPSGPMPGDGEKPVETSEGVRFPPDVDWFAEPDRRVVGAVEDFFEKVDRNGHDFMTALRIFEKHLDIVDDGLLIHLADYDIDEDGHIKDWITREVFVADPRNFQKVVHPRLMTPGGRYWICLRHRPRPDEAYRYDDGSEQWRREPFDGDGDAYSHPSPGSVGNVPEQGKVYEEPGECEQCGRKLHEVWWVAVEPGTGGSSTGQQGGGSENIVEYYVGPDPESGFPGEVVHATKFDPSYGYGTSPLVSVYDMAKTLLSMERFMRTFYEEERMPRSALFIQTRNPDSVQAMWKSAEDRNVSQDGHYVPKFGFDPGDSSATPQYMEFSRLPEEMQFEQVRDEFYRRIGSAYDVAPVFHGNVDAVGLQNQGPTQWQVTLLGAKKGQCIYNEEIFPALLNLIRLPCPECEERSKWEGFDNEQCGLCDGEGRVSVNEWELQLAPVELEDEMQQLQEKTMRANFAMSMQQLGFPPTGRNPETGEFEFPVEPEDVPDASPDGQGGPSGMGGLMGGGMGGGQGGLGGVQQGQGGGLGGTQGGDQ